MRPRRTPTEAVDEAWKAYEADRTDENRWALLAALKLLINREATKVVTGSEMWDAR